MTLMTSKKRPAARRSVYALALATVTVLATAALPAYGAAAATAPTRTDLYVNPATGSDRNAGTPAAPLKTIQQAMNEVQRGTSVHLAAGTYTGNVTTKVDGTPSARITIEGPSSGTAKLFGTAHVMAIKNSYYTLTGFSIDGQQAIEARTPVPQWPTTAAKVASFKSSVSSIAVNDRLIYIDSGSSTEGVTGTIINKMILTGAGGECVRIRNDATVNVIENTVIRYCGMYPEVQSGVFTYHNGEGVYVGTSPKSTDLSNYQDDQSRSNLLAYDTITTYGSECLDIKENSDHNKLYDSTCADNLEPTQYYGSMVELRGYDNTIEDAAIENSAGYGIKIASDTPAEDIGGNSLIANDFSGISAGALSDKSAAPGGVTCGDVISSGTSPGDFSKLSGYSRECPVSTGGQPAAG
jgi:hypothetical protein